MKRCEDEIDEIVNEEYGDQLSKKDETIRKLNEELAKKEAKLSKAKAELAEEKQNY